jgi:uncharacterized membrane protein
MLLAAGLGVLVGVPVSLVTGLKFGVLIGFDAAVVAYVGTIWLIIWPLDGEQTAALAVREDPTRAEADLVLLSAASASLVAVGFVLASAAHATGTAEVLRIGLGLLSVILSWGLIHSVFTLRYARLYHADTDGGIDFNQDEKPCYRDFAYLAFTVGMTFQVSDTGISDQAIRHTVLRHALLSFVFATGILATTVNLVASLTSR